MSSADPSTTRYPRVADESSASIMMLAAFKSPCASPISGPWGGPWAGQREKNEEKRKTWCSTSLLFFNFEFQKCVDSFFDPPKIRIANKTETQSQKKMWISHTAMAGIPFPHWREMRIWLWIWSLLQAGPSAIFGNEDLDGI